ncbi:MAG: hypothetical protein HUJ99_01300, partial [Bacteroidaceae bacterium]|nr:hypothetical protein [Bacteroidaceae bacterium]
EEKGDDYGLACAYASFGAISEYAYDAGIENFNLALEHLQRAERSEEIFYLYNEMAELAHLNMKEDDVLKFLDRMEKEAGNPTKTDPLSLYLRLLVHIAQNNEKEAQRIYERLMALWKSGGIESPYLDNNAKALCLYNCKYGDPEEAMDLLAYVNTPYEKLEIQIAYYKRKGLWANALNLTERYDSILKSLIIDAQRTKVINASAFYKNKELAAHNLELQFATTKSRIIWLSLLLLVVIIGTAAFNLSTRRHNKLLMAERDHTEEERKKAVKLSEMKTAFIQNISHEVRTPLNSIMGFNDLLNNSPEAFSPDERQEMVNHINVMSNRLASLLDTIIFISRLDSEDIKPNISRFPLSGVLAEINAAVANQTTPGVRLEMEQALSTPLFVKADRDLFARALSAVVENAVKFTQSGSIKLEVAERQVDTLEVSVTDTGCGIPTDSAELIFERFEKLNSFEPGFGLGLSTAREVLGMMGCAIRLDKSYTEGARFIITANR